jgi:8-oxo-dGTP pyrophosphatase MutT (NUDIX family)
MPRKYIVSHLGRTLTFSKVEFFSFFGSYKRIDAAGGLVQNGVGEFLMIKRKGYWDLPKGKIEKGENDEEGALREVEEETGLVGMNILNHLVDTFHTYEIKSEVVLKRSTWFLMKCEGRPKLTPQTEEEIELVEWCSAELLESRLPMSYATIALVWDAFKSSSNPEHSA